MISSKFKFCYVDTNIVISRIAPDRNKYMVSQQLDIARAKEFTFLTSDLTRLELSRFLHRINDDQSSSTTFENHIRDALAGIELIRLNTKTLGSAARFPFPHLGSLDSIHLASAHMVRATHFLTSDRQLINACAELGIATSF